MRSRHAASNNSLLSGVEDCCYKRWIKSAGARSGIDNSSARTFISWKIMQDVAKSLFTILAHFIGNAHPLMKL